LRGRPGDARNSGEACRFVVGTQRRAEGSGSGVRRHADNVRTGSVGRRVLG
jgi:hypothetical protein